MSHFHPPRPTLPAPAALRPGEDTGPTQPWQLRHCTDCGAAASFMAQTTRGQFCGVCYLAKQREGEVNTLPVVPEDTEEHFCGCPNCRMRRLNNMLSLEGMRVVVETSVDASETSVDASETSVDASETSVDAPRLLPGLPDALPAPVLRSLVKACVTQLRRTRNAVLDALADKVESDPRAYFEAEMTPAEVTAMAIEGLYDPSSSLSDGKPSLQPLRDVHGRLTGLLVAPGAPKHVMAILNQAAMSVPGTLYLEMRADAAEFVSDFQSQVAEPFARLVQRIPPDHASDLANFMVSCLGAVTYRSYETIMRTLYHAVHPGDDDAQTLSEDTEDMPPGLNATDANDDSHDT